ncbi:MAG: hypothetical protein KU28_00360 [Sulfurovum sp. PC08-66]|nr:MAG: hypothetical protein KU28_00360 [Sulfurovum sp. PC08-66]KIM12422.1 MAG: hypothetical protein KU37_00480 [Sulfuricurvum sp. PC08-66]
MRTFEKIFFGIALFFAFTLPLSKALISILSAAMFLLWLGDALYMRRLGEDGRRLWSIPVVRWFAIFILFGFVSLLWAHTMGDLWRYRFTTVYLFILIIPALVIYIKPHQTHHLLSAFLLGIFVSEIVSYGIFFELWRYKNVSPDDPTPFMMHIEYSTLLAFTSLFLLYRIATTLELRSRIIYGLFFVSVTINLFINGGRTGQMIFFVTSLLVLFLGVRNKLKALGLFVVGIVLVGALAWNLSSTFASRTQLTIDSIKMVLYEDNYATGLGNRLGSYFPAWELWKERPLLGAGWVGHEKLVTDLERAKYPQLIEAGYVHLDLQNQFLMIIVEFGLVGLVLFGMIFISLWRMPHSSKDCALKAIFLSVLLLYFMSEGWVHHFILTWGALMIAVLAIRSSALPHR